MKEAIKEKECMRAFRDMLQILLYHHLL